MKITLRNDRNRYSGPFGFLAQVIVLTMAVLLSAWILPGVHVDTVSAAILTALVISLLNSFVRPILIALTLPFTILSMGIFLLFINAIIILMASGLVARFHVDGFLSALLFSLLITLFNYLLEIPNRLMRRPKYIESDKNEETGYTPYEEVEDNTKQ